MREKILKIIEQQNISEFIDNVTYPNTAVFLDTECTGNRDTDEIVEIGMVKFTFNDDFSKIGLPENPYFSKLKDSNIPISPEAEKITGITSEMISGNKIDENELIDFLKDVDYYIAHNADFDRKKLEREFPKAFGNKIWMDTYRGMDWKQLQMGTGNLEYLLFRYGLYYEPHRALIDSIAGLVLLNQNFGSNKKVLEELFERFYEPKNKLCLTGLPFDKKDWAKENGCSWDSERRVWYKEIFVKDNDKELLWVSQNHNRWEFV